MKVKLLNIQSIKSAEYDLTEKGITQITGENSNGKSVLIKAMSFVANTHIKDKDERETIIKDDCPSGAIIMERQGMTLEVVVARIRENCYYKLKRATGEVITRTIREGGLEKLADEFGWTSFDGGVSLQIFETFGIMPFVNNRMSSDYEIVDYIITDKVASNFLENYEKVTYPAFKKFVSDLKHNIEVFQRNLDGITIYDIEKYENMLHRLKAFQRNINHLITYEPTRLPITKAFKYVNITPIKVNRLPIYKIAPSTPKVNSLLSFIIDLHTTMNGMCPTCGTKLKDREVCEH